MKNGMKTIFVVFMIAISLYFLLSFFISFNDSDFTTETVIYSSYSDYIDISGIAIRDEVMISADSEEIEDVIYYVENGDRVPVGSVVATYNTNAVGDSDFDNILYINNKIEQLSASIDTAIMYNTDTIDSQIKNEINTILDCREGGSLYEILKNVDNLQVLFNKSDISVNGDSYYVGVLDSYTNQKESLLSGSNSDEKDVIANTSGYFCVSCDGYESISPPGYLDITVDLYNSLISFEPQSVPENVVGKVQKVASWYFVSLLDTSDASNLTVGGLANIEIDFPESGKELISFYVQDISNSVNDKSAVVFRCETTTGDTVSLRKTDAKLMKKSYNGFKIDSDALRIVDDEYGVYVLSAQRVIFKPVEILYSNDDFLIVDAAGTGSRALTSKDEVIIGGKDLYNGKIVNR